MNTPDDMAAHFATASIDNIITFPPTLIPFPGLTADPNPDAVRLAARALEDNPMTPCATPRCTEPGEHEYRRTGGKTLLFCTPHLIDEAESGWLAAFRRKERFGTFAADDAEQQAWEDYGDAKGIRGECMHVGCRTMCDGEMSCGAPGHDAAMPQ